MAIILSFIKTFRLKGSKVWIKSNRQLKAEAKFREIQRKEATTRKRDHGQLANELLTKAKFLRTMAYQPSQSNVITENLATNAHLDS